MGNFGSNFLRGFQPTFARSFDTSFKYGIDQQEEERKRKEMLKAEQEQQGILSQLIAGQSSQIVPPKMNAQGTGFDVQPQDMSLQEQFGMYSKLTPQHQNAYEYWRELNAPKEDEYYAPNLGKLPTIQRYNKTKGRLEDTGQKDPFFTPEEPEAYEYIPANKIEGLEDYPKDYKMEIKKEGDKEVSRRGPFSPTQQKIDININQAYTQLSDYSRNTLDSYVKEIDNYNKILSTTPDPVTKNYTIYNPKTGQMDAVISEERLSKAKRNAIEGMKSFTDNNLGRGVSDYNELYKIYSKSPKSFWTTMHNAYAKDSNDEKDDAWLQTVKYKFYMDFGYDPVGRYELGGETKTVKR